MDTRITAAALAFALTGAAGCQEQGVQAPRTPGDCWHMATLDDGTVKFNRVARNQPDLENCAAKLELMRRSFLSLGGGRTEVTGAYQGRFLFLKPSGIYSAKSLTSGRYIALVRTADGRLVIPGSMRPIQTPAAAATN